jgi:catalase
MPKPGYARILALLCLLGTAACRTQAEPQATSQQHQVTADAVVTALENAYGVHPGERRNHTKGMCASGTFAGTTDGAAYSRSALFSQSPVPVVARFSIAGGNPTVPDADGARGAALEFRLPKWGLQHDDDQHSHVPRRHAANLSTR